MKPLKIGIVAESTLLPVRGAIEAAARMGAKGVQLDATGDLAPSALTETGKREFRTLLRSFDLELAALNVPIRRGLDVSEDLQPRLDRVRKAMDLAFALGARRVVVPLPRLPDEATAPRAQTLRESLLALGAYGDRVGCFVALEIGFDASAKVREYLSGFDVGSLKVTYDPANFMLHGHDPLANLTPLEGLVEHVHARDARTAGVSRGMQEVALGAGDVDWMSTTATLQVLEYDGFLAVEREQGQRRFADTADGVKFLRRFALPV